MFVYVCIYIHVNILNRVFLILCLFHAISICVFFNDVSFALVFPPPLWQRPGRSRLGPLGAGNPSIDKKITATWKHKMHKHPCTCTNIKCENTKCIKLKRTNERTNQPTNQPTNYFVSILDKSPPFLRPRVRKSANGPDIVVLRRGDVIDFHCVLAPWETLGRGDGWLKPWLMVVKCVMNGDEWWYEWWF